jgi:hypothetical protein
MTLVDGMDSLEFWIGLNHEPSPLYKAKSFKSGSILASATGSKNLPTIIRAAGYTGSIYGASLDSEKSFSSLETDRFKKVSMNSLLEAAKEIQEPIFILSAEYEGDEDYVRHIQELVEISVRNLKDAGIVSFVVNIPEKIPDFLKDRAMKVEELIIKAQNSALKNDIFDTIKYFLKAIAHLKAPNIDIDFDDVPNAIDIERPMWTGLFNNLKTIDEKVIKLFSFSYSLSGYFLKELIKRHRVFKLMGTIGVNTDEENRVRIYGAVHKLKKRDDLAIFNILSKGTSFPHFAFYEKSPIANYIQEYKHTEDIEKIEEITRAAYLLVSDRFLSIGNPNEDTGRIKLSE